ncbi:hypothetical protein ACPUD8_20245 [Brevibacterium sp. FAM 25378]|uniref:hypothetical protein n=1 Tax=unclassified Brevibacterium TaxID=2614124 RepID=UPI00197A93FC|nr:hypothetical protein [Brevibacterium sp. S22]
MQERIAFKFSVHDFTVVRKAWQIGPAKSGDKEQLPKSDGFCLYSPAFKQFVYRPKLVERMAEALDTAEKYQALLRCPPIAKKPT